MPAIAVDAGGGGDCFFYSLHGAATAANRVRQVAELFHVDSGTTCWDLVGDADVPPSAEEFMLCVRVSLAAWIRANTHSALGTSFFENVRAIVDEGGGGSEAASQQLSPELSEAFTSGRGGMTGFMMAAANIIEAKGGWMGPMYLEIVDIFLPAYRPGGLGVRKADQLCLYIITDLPPGFRPPDDNTLVLINYSERHYRYVAMEASPMRAATVPGAPGDGNSFFYALYDAARSTNNLERLARCVPVKGPLHRGSRRQQSCWDAVDEKAGEWRRMMAFTKCLRYKTAEAVRADSAARDGGFCARMFRTLLWSNAETRGLAFDGQPELQHAYLAALNSGEDAHTTDSRRAAALFTRLVSAGLAEDLARDGAWVSDFHVTLLQALLRHCGTGLDVRIVRCEDASRLSKAQLRLPHNDHTLILIEEGQSRYLYACEEGWESTSRGSRSHGSQSSRQASTVSAVGGGVWQPGDERLFVQSELQTRVKGRRRRAPRRRSPPHSKKQQETEAQAQDRL